MLKAFLQHLPRLQAKKDVEKLVCVAPQECPSQHHDAFRTRREGAERVPLGRVPFELVNLIRQRVIKERIHVTADIVNGREPPDLVSVGLPEGAIQPSTLLQGAFRVLAADDFTELGFLKVTGQQPLFCFANDHRCAAVGIDDTTLVAATARYAISMPPKVAQLAAVSSHDKNGGSAAYRRPSLTGASKVLAQAQLGQAGVQPLAHDAAVAQLHLVHTHLGLSMSWVAQAVDEEHPHAGQCQEAFSRGLVT